MLVFDCDIIQWGGNVDDDCSDIIVVVVVGNSVAVNWTSFGSKFRFTIDNDDSVDDNDSDKAKKFYINKENKVKNDITSICIWVGVSYIKYVH